MNQEQSVELDREEPQPSNGQVWTQPLAGRSWQRLPSINRLLFAASFACLGISGVALLGPALAEAAREAYHPYTSEGKRETCLSNLQSIARAVSLYAQDNSGHLPLVPVKSGDPGSTWITDITPYISDSKPWTCPVAAAPEKGRSSYALNPVLAGGPVSGADDPAATLLLGDASAPGALTLQPPYPGWDYSGDLDTETGLAFRHEGVAGVVYADGHAGTLDSGSVKNAALWGGSAAARASLERIALRSVRSQALVTALRAGDEAGTVRVLRSKAADVAAASRDLLALWEFNAQKSSNDNLSGAAATAASQSVETLGWNLAWAWHRLGQEAALKQLESRVKAQAAVELERVKSVGLQSRTSPGGSFDAPQGWTSDETAEGNYRTLNLRSRVPGLFLYVEVGTRSTLAASPSPIDWRESERRLQTKYGAGYRRIGMSRSSLSGYPAGVWEYELDKPGGPRLHKRLIGTVNGWNSTTLATTVPIGSFSAWKTILEQIAQSL